MANYYVTVAGAGSLTGANWANAFGLSEWLAHMAASAASGDRYFVAGGTSTLTGNFSTALTGSVANNILCIGVASGTTAEPPTAADFADGTDRPLIECGAYSFTCPAAWTWRGFRFTTSHASGINIASGNIVNSYINSSGAYPCAAITSSGGLNLLDCEIISANGNGANLSGNSRVMYCYFNAVTKYSIYMTGASLTLLNSIFNYGYRGVYLGAGNNCIIGNTFDNVQEPVDGNTYGNNIFLNNSYSDSSEDDVYFDAVYNQTLVDHNNHYGDYADAVNITEESNSITVDPLFTDSVSGDFSLTSESQLIDAEFKMRLGVTA